MEWRSGGVEEWSGGAEEQWSASGALKQDLESTRRVATHLLAQKRWVTSTVQYQGQVPDLVGY